MIGNFDEAFKALTGKPPFPWQRTLFHRLLEGTIPLACDIPTGLGKTSVIAIWLLARSFVSVLPRRLVYIVNRRTVVDQTTFEVERLRERLPSVGINEPVAISTLRGQMADNRAWSKDPSQPAIICGTVDMIGSRLLFSGYRVGFKGRPLHAGFLGQDALLVHDEAHLEPAFQMLLESILSEQKRCGDPWPLRVMALTATPRAGQDAFCLGQDDFAHPVVTQRINATKLLSLHTHGDNDLVEKAVAQVLSYAESDRAVLVFLRAVEDVRRTAARLGKAGLRTQQLTGTMRGYERDRLVDSDSVFNRFLPHDDRKVDSATGTVVLLCTSAGEVGVNLSADHLVCDLSTFDAMAQRFGRVNRFGFCTNSEIHVFHPSAEYLEADKAPEARARLATLALLHRLIGNASPMALSGLDVDARRDAFAPAPKIVPATEILFDAWALTTIRGKLPGRPPVSAYLHGVAEWEPPTTQVAWRAEVDLVSGMLLKRYPPADLLDDYPLKPHELLSDRTTRIVDTLIAAGRQSENALTTPVWIIDEEDEVHVEVLGELVGGDRRRLEERLAGRTMLLSPKQSQPVAGILTADSWSAGGLLEADVADRWFDEQGKPRRARIFDAEAAPRGMRLIRTMILQGEREEADDEAISTTPQRWSWYECPDGADDEGSRSGANPVLLEVHSADVERIARAIVERLPLASGMRHAIVLASKHHDHGKNRRVWQRSIGNTDRTRLFAKSGGAMRTIELTPYRHELGSMLDAGQDLLSELEPDERELALHLIAAHHGRARPQFPEGELFVPEARGVDVRAEGLRVMQRFARLQRRFGRWGLAYLESLVRAADYAASAEPSKVEEVAR